MRISYTILAATLIFSLSTWADPEDELLEASASGDAAAILKLLDGPLKGTDLNKTKRGGWFSNTALDMAARGGHVEATRLLMNRGMSPGPHECWGYGAVWVTTLQEAVEARQVKTIEAILPYMKPQDIDFQFEVYKSALAEGYYNMFENVYAPNGYKPDTDPGTSAAMMRLLLSYGANPLLKPNSSSESSPFIKALADEKRFQGGHYEERLSYVQESLWYFAQAGVPLDKFPEHLSKDYFDLWLDAIAYLKVWRPESEDGKREASLLRPTKMIYTRTEAKALKAKADAMKKAEADSKSKAAPNANSTVASDPATKK